MKREEIWTELFNSIVEYIRTNHAKEIDDAYDYFWEEESPEDFLSGVALELAFVNFEDWLVCDYLPKEGKGFIDRYMEETKPDGETAKILEAMNNTSVSLYEVASVGDSVTLRDIALGGEVTLKDSHLRSLSPGDLFAARILGLDGEHLMSRAVYPFGSKRKDQVLTYLNHQFERYKKNENPDGTMEQFLREESYIFNTIWVTCLDKPAN